MKNRNNINLFFLELLFSIFFFVIVSTICLQVFAKAHYLNIKTSATTHALEIVQNEIELFYYDIQNENKSYYEDSVTYYTSDFCISFSEDNSEYVLTKKYSLQNNFVYMNITFTRISDSLVLFSQNVQAF